MDQTKLNGILDKLKNIKIAVVGDFFLDKYLIIDSEKDEPSIETGLTAYQVTGKRMSPGAAGTVASNLRALGVGYVYAVGAVGNDGEGWELRKALKDRGILTDYLFGSDLRVTPTYTKPMRKESTGEREINRLDIKNWTHTPEELQDKIAESLYALAGGVDAILVLDQVVEENCGIITERMRTVLSDIGKKYPELVIFADSRAYTSKFRDIIVKCNNFEAVRAILPAFKHEAGLDIIRECGAKLMQRTGKPVFITMGSKGQLIVNGTGISSVPAVKVEGPIDICGAGDSATAGTVCGLCCRAGLEDAALLGNIVASITIQQLGTTGTASPEQVLERFDEYTSNF